MLECEFYIFNLNIDYHPNECSFMWLSDQTYCFPADVFVVPKTLV